MFKAHVKCLSTDDISIITTGIYIFSIHHNIYSLVRHSSVNKHNVTIYFIHFSLSKKKNLFT